MEAIRVRGKKLFFSVALAWAAVLLVSCSGGGGGGGGTPPPPQLTSIALTPLDPGLSPTSGTGLQLTVTAQYSDSSSTDVTSSASFVSASPAVVSVSASGWVNAVAGAKTGQSSVITASFGGMNASTSVWLIFTISGVNDPLAPQQWHLSNTGQTAYADTPGTAGNDINVASVYSTWGYGGRGVIAAVVDTGLEIAHEDLSANVVPGGSWNFGNGTTDPTNTASTGDHGTGVSGLIAMASDNGKGGIGVAPAASLKGFNFLLNQAQANQLASLGGSSASPNSADVWVFNESYGYSNKNDFPVDPTVEAQYASGASTLRGGKGALYVKSAGNGFGGFGTATCTAAKAAGISCQNASMDPYNTIPYHVVVGALNADGRKSSYSTAGSAIWVSAPGGEYGYNASVAPGFIPVAYQPAMVTTDQSGCAAGYSKTGVINSVFNNAGAPNTACNYANTFNGTSSAAPVTVGVIALMLDANSSLTWRDVKHILATTATQVDASIAPVSVTLGNGSYVAEQGWITNAAGRKFHDYYGFGRVDAYAAVSAARAYTAGSLGTFANTGWISSGTLSLAIPDNSVTGVSNVINVPTSITIEAVQIQVSATHTWTGDLGIELTSPTGTKSILKNIRDGFQGDANLAGMVLASNAFYGESGAGNWTVKVVDGDAFDTGTLTNWQIRIYGH